MHDLCWMTQDDKSTDRIWQIHMYGCVNPIHHEIRLVAQATIYRWISYWKAHSENQVGKLTTNKSRPRHRVVQMVRMHQQLREQKQPPGFGRRLGDGLTYGWRSCSTHIWHAWNGLRGFNGMVFSGFIAWGTWKIREACDLMYFWTPKPKEHLLSWRYPWNFKVTF